LDEAMHEQGFVLTSLEARHLDRLRHLNNMHDDPFDRLLVAVAAEEGRMLLTRDAAILSAGLEHVQAG
jgi:PIN domain nuclease of toxin-antitoxin system